MKIITMAALLGALLLPALASAQKPAKGKDSILMTWFKHLKDGLSESTVSGKYQRVRVTAVAAVRGAKQDTAQPNKPAWMGAGDTKKAVKLRKEKAEFAQAVDLILAGKFQDGASALDAFEKAHPKSQLLPEVRQARDKVKELETAAAPESKPAAESSEAEPANAP